MEKIYNAKQAIEAMKARRDGVWDNKELKKLGPLSSIIREDFYRILDLTEEIEKE